MQLLVHTIASQTTPLAVKIPAKGVASKTISSLRTVYGACPASKVLDDHHLPFPYELLTESHDDSSHWSTQQ